MDVTMIYLTDAQILPESYFHLQKLSLLFSEEKKNVSACLLQRASVVHLWEMPSTAEVWELPTLRALQGTAEHPSASTHCPVTRAGAAFPLPVTSPVSFLNHQKTPRVFTYTIFTLLQNLSFRSGVGILPSMGEIQTCGLFFQTKFHWKAATLLCSSSVYDFSLCTAVE